MKIVGKIIKWTILACIAAFFLTWWGAMLKNYIRTVKYRDVMENMVLCDCESSDTNEYVYERILSYAEDEIKTYFVVDCGDYYNGGTTTYSRHSDGEWHMYEHVSWSGGSADDTVWPYWHHHYFKFTNK